MNESLNLGERLAQVANASTAEEALVQTVEVAAAIAPAIDAVARIFEAAQYEDEAIATAWRKTMQGRRADYRAVIQRLANEGKLSEDWTVETETDMFYTLTLQASWRELTQELGWDT